MTRFNRTLIWMAAFLALVAALGSLVGVRLLEIFQANPFFNGVILIVLAAGIVVNVRQVVLLSGEAQWIDSFRRSNPERGAHARQSRTRQGGPVGAVDAHHPRQRAIAS